mmetsp:Transcript_22/g.32  ORF Transcript_22/g.32 Transcript_22/m.32 type:complete len:105 (-) Transcript_22:207-521(-)
MDPSWRQEIFSVSRGSLNYPSWDEMENALEVLIFSDILNFLKRGDNDLLSKSLQSLCLDLKNFGRLPGITDRLSKFLLDKSREVAKIQSSHPDEVMDFVIRVLK